MLQPVESAAASYVKANYSWLNYRFALDRRSINSSLRENLQKLIAAKATLKILDVGAGSGANILHLAPYLRQVQHWVLCERDQSLLEKVAENLVTLEATFEGPANRELLQITKVNEDFLSPLCTVYRQQFDLITANAVFDLLSPMQFSAWIALLQNRYPDTPPLYFTINLDHDLALSPHHVDDGFIVRLFHHHMTRPQPFGRAMGHHNASFLIAALRENHFTVETAPSNWHIAPEESVLLRENLNFIKVACLELEPTLSEQQQDKVTSWLGWREEQLAQQKLSLRITHQDILAYREAKTC